jgi:hypothetical protein
MKTNVENQENSNLSYLIRNLKVKDLNYANLSKAIQIIYLILIPLYAILSALKYLETFSINVIISGVSLILAFLIFALFFRKYYKEYKFVDYSLPTVLMLKKAAYRYQPFQKRTVWILLALVLMDIGYTFDWVNEPMSALTIQIVFWGVMFLAFIVGIIVWYIKYKPLHDEARRLLKEIEGD